MKTVDSCQLHAQTGSVHDEAGWPLCEHVVPTAVGMVDTLDRREGEGKQRASGRPGGTARKW